MAGKPKNGALQSEMHIHRMRYRKAIKDKEQAISLDVSNSLHDALINKDSKTF